MSSNRRWFLLLTLCLLVAITMGCGLWSWSLIRRAGKLWHAPQAASEIAASVSTPGTKDQSGTRLPLAVGSEGDDEERLLVALYKRVIPSVASIQVIRKAEGPGPAPWGSDSDTGQYRRGQGSGFVVDGVQGILVTNNHVVVGAEVVEVVLWDGTILPASVLGGDPDSDVAAIKVEANGRLQSVAMGDSDSVEVGCRAVAIGNPFGWEGTLTAGIVSGLGRTLHLGHVSEKVSGRFSIPEMIQTDAAVNLGNSGGPLLDSKGRVIGMTSAMNSSSGVSSGVGFAIPINTIKRILPDLIEKGHYAYPWLGIRGCDVRRIHVEKMHLPVDCGAIIQSVVEDGPAGRAGLRGATSTIDYYGEKVGIGGDVIITIDDVLVRQFDDLLVYLVREKRAGEPVTLTIIREGKRKQVSLALGERPVD